MVLPTSSPRGRACSFTLSATRPFAAGETTVLRVELESENDDSDYDFATTAGTVEEFTLGDATSTELQPVAGLTTTMTVVSEPNDVDRLDDTITLTVTYAADKGDKIKRGDMAIEDPLELTVVDQHKLPDVMIASKDGITIVVDKKDTPVETLMEGQIGTVTLVADRGTSTDDVPDYEDIEVAVKAMAGSTADSADYDLRDLPVEIDAAAGDDGTGSFTLEVEVDQDVGNEVLMLMATVSGDKMYGTDTMDVELGSISFVDATAKKIEPKTEDEAHAAIDKAKMKGAGDNGRWTAGETMTLMASDLFRWPETTTSVVLGNSLSEDQKIATAATTNDSLTITAVSSGMTAISVTATVTSEASGFVATQTVSTSATVKFPVMVDADAITVMSQADVDAAVAAAIKKAADMASSKQWEPGGATAMVALSELFDVPDSIRAIYDATSSDMGDIEAGISGDKMYVTLMPKSAGTATISVTAADTASGGSAAGVSFDAAVMAQASIVAKSQAEVDKVFMDAGADMLMAGGDAVMVDMSMLYTIAPGVEPTYTAMSDMADVLAASTSGMILTLMPMSAGDAMIMVEAVDSGSQSIVPVMYDASVAAAAITYMLEGPEMMDLVEGGMAHANGTPGSAMLTVTASAMVAADTEVMIMRDRSESDATDDDFMLDPMMITIEAGMDSGSTMLTAVDDGMDEPMEELVLYAMVDGMAAEGEVHLHIWDAAVPALPVIAQLLLAAFLAIGGYRRYLRR